ncbi:FAD-dependent oxidoreductase [Streptomyces sp. NPDC050658]|uniref:FAD-dependent oxidoreductase n=1 Tax=unclassified Streptomyces TaxID=2593676 RepID=UPI003445795C
MPTAVVAGGSVAGLAGALALSGVGYRVLVVERAPKPPRWPVGEAVSRWKRTHVPQGLHSHTLTSLGVRVLRERAPQVLAAARVAGALTLDLTAALPADATDGAPEPGDDELVGLGCRRSTLELILHQVVSDLPGVTIWHGATVDGIETDPSMRRVHAVRVSGGSRIPADIVVDATGRRALSRSWLRDAGVPVAPDRTSPAGLSGYSRFYRLEGDTLPGPLTRGNSVGDIYSHYASVLHPADDGTFSVTLARLPGDRALTGLRTAAGFTAAARATPGLAAWLADGVSEPISPVRSITSPPNTLSGTAAAGPRPLAGVFPLGDAACITNPLFGRGMSLALEHAFRLADLLVEHPDVDVAQREAVARMTAELFTPWYEQAAASDQLRIARWRAAVEGVPAPAPPARTPDGPPGFDEVAAAARVDGTVWRGLTRVLMTLRTPAEVFGDGAFVDRVRRAAAEARARGGETRKDELSRDALVREVAAAEGALV